MIVIKYTKETELKKQIQTIKQIQDFNLYIVYNNNYCNSTR